MRGLRRVSWQMIVVLLLAGTLAGCSRGGASNNRGMETAQVNPTEQAGTPTRTVEPAPEPVTVSVNELQMIEEWQSSQVPAYPGASQVRFEPYQTQVENGGMMVYRTDDSPEQVVAFYRGALQALGWQELRADANKVVARRGEAALTVNVSNQEGGTAILLMLTDAP